MRDGGIVGFQVDITELKRKEEELRTAKEKAEQLNQAKSAFLATVSHEVRTPLNGVLGLLRTLQDDGQLSERQYKQVSTAHHSAEQLLAILNQILDLSKLEAGKLELEESPFDVREIIQSAISLVEAQFVEKGLKLDFSVAQSVPQMVVGDSGRLRQILLNLLNNAVKFTDRGRSEEHTSELQSRHDR